MHINAGLVILVLAAPSLAAPLNVIAKRGFASATDVLAVLDHLTYSQVVDAYTVSTKEASDTVTAFLASDKPYSSTADSKLDAALAKLAVGAFSGEQAAQTALKTFYGHFQLANAVDTLPADSAAGEIAKLFEGNGGKLPFEAPAAAPKKSFLSSVFGKSQKVTQPSAAVQTVNSKFEALFHDAQAEQMSALADDWQNLANKMPSTSKRSIDAFDNVVINSEPPVFDFSSDAGLEELN